jgi:hypothetical protein
MNISWLCGRQCWRLFYFLVSICLVLLSVSLRAGAVACDYARPRHRLPGGWNSRRWHASNLMARLYQRRPETGGCRHHEREHYHRWVGQHQPRAEPGSDSRRNLLQSGAEAGRRHNHYRVLERHFLFADHHSSDSFERGTCIHCSSDGVATVPRHEPFGESRQCSGDSQLW